MPNLPSASNTVSTTAGAQASGRDILALLIPSTLSPDLTPRLFGSADSIAEQHGYSWGVEYAALHFALTGKPLIVVGMPIDEPGEVSREDVSGNTGGSVTTVTAGSDGVLAEHDAIVRVKQGGTVGTSQIVLEYSLDGGRTYKSHRLGTGTSFVVPLVNVTMTFTASTLVAGDVIHTWHGSHPRASMSDLTAVRTAFAARQQGFRALLPTWDIESSAEATAVRDMVRAYDTSDDRYIYSRISLDDRMPLAAVSLVERVATGSPVITFDDDVGGDTIARATGSWLSDGFAVGDSVIVDGSADNDGEYFPSAVSATDLDVAGLTDEATVSGVSVTARTGLTLSSSGQTITRSRGSWLADGFRVGAPATLSGTGSATNDFAGVAPTVVTDLAMTFPSSTITAPEQIAAEDVTISQGTTLAAWGAAQITEFAGVSSSPEIDIAAGRARRTLPYSGWYARIPAAWEAFLREFAQPAQQPAWRKDLGALGSSLTDEAGNTVEWDDRLQGEAFTQAGFTALRSWGNGPIGTFVAMTLTRADEGSLLQQTQNKAVVDIARTVCQAATENVVGRVLEKKTDGSGEATEDALREIETYVNGELEKALLVDNGTGALCSGAVWTASRADRYDSPAATMHGVLVLTLNGVVHTVETVVKVQ